ncbi:Sec-independent protein translocase protein TatB [Anthocerotibacter panamensis]|uniref:Sec-independent protein translocase protein TatB n=1 Tax=Anthocerotibacter panamensis TaxID=2857077 RepID=UPI001FDA386F|nr:Sec-independent protein translocase protein TatB [Anthocerotibacter panamensis]
MDGIFGVGPLELGMIGIVALLVFGPKRLPELGRTVGQITRKVRNASRQFQDEFQRELDAVDLKEDPKD